jgi:gluconate 2-dehydrogenase gamma chain
MIDSLSRRNFLSRGSAAVSAIWLSAHWPAIVAAAEYARQAAKSSAPAKFQFFTPEEAAEIDAIAARIIPSGETPGAREAGVVFFVDRALTTFAVDDQKIYRQGLPGIQARLRELFPAIDNFSAASPDQQDQVLRSFDVHATAGPGIYRPNANAVPLFETLRVHTIVGFLIDPDSATGGNRDAVGWRLIGRDRDHMFQPPFGYYDKDYAGWESNSPDLEKSKT